MSQSIPFALPASPSTPTRSLPQVLHTQRSGRQGAIYLAFHCGQCIAGLLSYKSPAAFLSRAARSFSCQPSPQRARAASSTQCSANPPATSASS